MDPASVLAFSPKACGRPHTYTTQRQLADGKASSGP
jgi:hypothetical protein